MHRLRGACQGPVSAGQRASRRRPAVDRAVLAGRIATELEGLWASVVQGSHLLYDELLVHSLGECELCSAVCEHLAPDRASRTHQYCWAILLKPQALM